MQEKKKKFLYSEGFAALADNFGVPIWGALVVQARFSPWMFHPLAVGREVAEGVLTKTVKLFYDVCLTLFRASDLAPLLADNMRKQLFIF